MNEDESEPPGSKYISDSSRSTKDISDKLRKLSFQEVEKEIFPFESVYRTRVSSSFGTKPPIF